VHNDAVEIWKSVVFKDMRSVPGPLERIERTIENVMLDDLGREVFDGGCGNN